LKSSFLHCLCYYFIRFYPFMRSALYIVFLSTLIIASFSVAVIPLFLKQLTAYEVAERIVV
jgi:hypothetical protein